MKPWLNIESGIEFDRYTYEFGLYLFDWTYVYKKTEGGLTTIRLGPFYLSVWDNKKLKAWMKTLHAKADENE